MDTACIYCCHLSKAGELSVGPEFEMKFDKFISYYEDHGCNSYLARLARQRFFQLRSAIDPKWFLMACW